jgi:hypothetical protein
MKSEWLTPPSFYMIDEMNQANKKTKRAAADYLLNPPGIGKARAVAKYELNQLKSERKRIKKRIRKLKSYLRGKQ